MDEIFEPIGNGLIAVCICICAVLIVTTFPLWGPFWLIGKVLDNW